MKYNFCYIQLIYVTFLCCIITCYCFPKLTYTQWSLCKHLVPKNVPVIQNQSSIYQLRQPGVENQSQGIGQNPVNDFPAFAHLWCRNSHVDGSWLTIDHFTMEGNSNWFVPSLWPWDIPCSWRNVCNFGPTCHCHAKATQAIVKLVFCLKIAAICHSSRCLTSEITSGKHIF